MKKSAKNFFIIFFLGISSGLPIALVLSTLKAMLVDGGFDLKTVGFFSLVSIPYSLKIFFAPIIDSRAIPFLTKKIGQRRSWIIVTQITLAIFIFFIGASQSLVSISIFAVLTAFASASQDVVIDGYRIELIEKENQGIASSLYVYGYRVGMLISGALALALSDFVEWNLVYFFMSLIMITNIFTVLIANETRKNFVEKKENFSSWFKDFVIAPIADFTKREKWIIMFGFIICFKLCDAFAGNLTIPFLLETGFSKMEIATIAKTFGLFATLSGVFVGGLLARKIGIVKSLWIASIFQMISNLSFAFLSKVGYSVSSLYFVIFIENFASGIGDCIFVAYLSGLCNIAFSATQYSLLVSLATLGRSIFTSSAGVFASSLGWYNFFIFSTFLAIPALIFLFLLNYKKCVSQS